MKIAAVTYRGEGLCNRGIQRVVSGRNIDGSINGGVCIFLLNRIFRRFYQRWKRIWECWEKFGEGEITDIFTKHSKEKFLGGAAGGIICTLVWCAKV